MIERKIETNKIVKNKLPIANFGQLSYSIFQDEYLIENSKKANECLKYLIENLKKVYDFIELLDYEDYEVLDNRNIVKLRNEIDLYQIGDIINFLETIKIVKSKGDVYE